MTTHNYTDKINSSHFHTDRRYVVSWVPVPKFWLLSQATIEIVVANQNLDDRKPRIRSHLTLDPTTLDNLG